MVHKTNRKVLTNELNYETTALLCKFNSCSFCGFWEQLIMLPTKHCFAAIIFVNCSRRTTGSSITDNTSQFYFIFRQISSLFCFWLAVSCDASLKLLLTNFEQQVPDREKKNIFKFKRMQLETALKT